MMDIKEIAPKLTQKLSIAINDDEAVEFAEALIESYKAELLKEVVEPVGYLRTTEKALVFMPLTHVKDGEYFFTESQLIAAVAKKDEEIEQLKDAQFKRLEREAEKRMKLREQLATAEQRVAEACAKLVIDMYDSTDTRNVNDFAKAIRSGGWKKFRKKKGGG